MSLERMVCDSCGAPLEIPASANYVTCQHCGCHLRIHRNEGVHFTHQLENIDERTRRIDGKLNSMSKWREIEALDRKWEMDRQQYLLEDGSIPTEADANGSLFTALLIGSLCILGVIFVSWLFAAGLLLAFVGLGDAMKKLELARTYFMKSRDYEKRRRELLEGANSAQPNPEASHVT